MPQSPKINANYSLVRSGLEYGACTWDPCLRQDTDQYEKIQWRAARFYSHTFKRTASVNAIISDLEWKPLATRRKHLRLTLLYKIMNNHVLLTPDSLSIQLADSRTRSSHHLKLRPVYAKSSVYKNSAIPRTIIDWNNLPALVVEAPTVATFKRRLSTFVD